MKMKLRFLGAARNVTGSRHLLEANGCKLLVDCGLFQERDFGDRNWHPFEVKPSEIDAVFLTHAHLDHIGLLPKLVKEGFQGKVHCTEVTAEIAKIILLDAAKLQEEDAEYKKKRHKREGRSGVDKIKPLYCTADAEACFPLFCPIKYGIPLRITDTVEAKFYEAGHVLGSSIIKIIARNATESRSVLFSGDVGRPNRPIVRDADITHEADYILVESTYGDRTHHDVSDIKQHMAELINATISQGGDVIIPSFALERSQEVLYYINELMLDGRVPRVKVFLDSPMATSITKVFKKHPELFDEEMIDFVHNQSSPFGFKGLQLVATKKQSQAINETRGPKIIIAGSGMCTGGRIKHHLVRYIESPQHTIMFVGYQAAGTLGRRLVSGDKEVRILGQDFQVNARVEQVHGFSAHADKEELLTWLQGLDRPPRRVFVVHGEEESAVQFGVYLKEKTGWDTYVPQYQEEVDLVD